MIAQDYGARVADADHKAIRRVVAFFLLTLVVSLFLAYESMRVLSAVRAFVGGESLWSKGQKEAVNHLFRYGLSRDPANFEAYLDAIAVPLGDSRARIELDSPDPRLDIARQGLLDGKNDAADIDDMVLLFRRFRHVSFMRSAIDIWAEGDRHIARLTVLAAELRSEIESPAASEPGSAQHIGTLMAEIDAVNRTLTPLEERFSFTLGEASRKTRRLLVVTMFAMTALLSILGVLISRAVLRERGHYRRILQQSEERYRSFFESSRDAALLCDESGAIISVNPAACEMFGRSATELAQTERAQLLADDESRRREMYSELERTGQFKGNLKFRRKDDSVFIGETSISRIGGSATNARISLTVRDITERIRAEEEIHHLNHSLEYRVAMRTAQLENANRDLRTSNRELEAFSYSAAHDLRTPLRAISGFSQILLADYSQHLDDEGKNYLKRIADASQRLARLIDDLLDLARITRREIHPAYIDLSALAEETLATLRAADPERTVETRIEPGIMAWADANLAQTLLSNLLDNAWKFTRHSALPRIEFGAHPINGQRACFVRDNGCGFDMAHREKLFGVFNRLHGVKDYEGTGIGLATVQRIVDRHGGRVWAEAAVDQGASFYFTLPENERSGVSASQ